MKRSRQSVPSAQTGDAPTDGGTSSTRWVNAGGRNAATDASRRAAGQLAPRPQNSKQPLLGSSAHTAGTVASMARVKNAGSSGSGYAPTAGSFNPVQNNAMANLTGQSTGQAEVLPRGNSARITPQTRTPVTKNPLATNKAKSRKLDVFYGMPGGGGY